MGTYVHLYSGVHTYNHTCTDTFLCCVEEYMFAADSASEGQKPTLLFTNNESRSHAGSQPHNGIYTKDGINQFVVHGMFCVLLYRMLYC